MKPLSKGMLVRHSITGQIGVVIDAGPYGDAPFQVADGLRTLACFVEEDGTSPYNSGRWQPLQVAPADKQEGAGSL